MIHHDSEKGEEVQVITLFAGEFQGADLPPFARTQHGYWGNPPRPMTLRRAEDTAALAALGADAQHLDFLDAVYRAGPGGEWLYASEEALWAEVHPLDPLAQGSARALADRLAGLLDRQGGTRIYAPLGVGHHIDHQITRQAAGQLLRAGYPIVFYEEYPYAQEPEAVERALRAAGSGPWRAEDIVLHETDLTAKVFALGYYRSQLRVLFGSAEAMPSRVWAFAAARSPQASLAERIWWPADEGARLDVQAGARSSAHLRRARRESCDPNDRS
jgi:hypothetical protein